MNWPNLQRTQGQRHLIVYAGQQQNSQTTLMLCQLKERGLKMEQFVSNKIWDKNGDGKFNHKDIIHAAKNMGKGLKGALDLDGDGSIDLKDFNIAAKVTGATVVGAGATLGVGALTGASIVSGTATSIATAVTATAGAAIGGAVGPFLGTTSSLTVALLPSFWGPVTVIMSKTVVSSKIVSGIAAIGSLTGSMSTSAIAKVSGLKVIQAIAIKTGVSKGSLIVIAGIPIAREAAIAAGLISIVIVAGYAYILLNKECTSAEVEAAIPT
jgi:hypothetical protein